MKNLSQTPGEIPSFKYRHYIKDAAKSFFEIPYFSGTTIALILKTGEVAWLSTTPKTTVKIISTGLFRGDLLLKHYYCKYSRAIFPEEFATIDDAQSSINSILEKDKLYRAYCIVRACQDCSIMITCNTVKKEIDHRLFYKNTIDIMERSVNKFLDKTMGIYAQVLPALKNCRFYTEKEYRHQIINTRHSDADVNVINLNKSELDILYWSAQGKTAVEIAELTGLTKNTIDTYRQRLIEKLNVVNITQAVYLASKIGLIV